MKLNYDELGEIDEDEKGTWEAKCGCSGYIDENFEAVITENCTQHRRIERCKPQENPPTPFKDSIFWKPPSIFRGKFIY